MEQQHVKISFLILFAGILKLYSQHDHSLLNDCGNSVKYPSHFALSIRGISHHNIQQFS
jgi:hypothetical protein